MKALSAVFVAVIMMLAFVSCGNVPEKIPEVTEPPKPKNYEAYEKYAQASGALEDAGSMSANTYMKISIDTGNEALVMEMSGIVGAVAPNKLDMEMDAQLFVNISDGSGRYSTGWQHIYLAYYKEGYLYTHLQEMVTLKEVKYKTRVHADEAARQVNLFGPVIFPESAIKEMSESRAENEPDNEFEADSGTLLRFVLGAPALQELLDAIAQSKLADLLGEDDSPNPTFQYGDVALTALLNEKGGMSNISMSFPFEATDADGMRITSEIEMLMTLTRIGNVEIDFPDGLETYESVYDTHEI